MDYCISLESKRTIGEDKELLKQFINTLGSILQILDVCLKNVSSFKCLELQDCNHAIVLCRGNCETAPGKWGNTQLSNHPKTEAGREK